MPVAVGITIGNATAAVAVARAANEEHVIANADGERTTPTVVGYGAEDELNIGLTAVQGLVRNAANSPRRFVDLLGVPFSDPAVARVQTSQECKIVEKEGKPYFHPKVKEDPISVPDVAGLVLNEVWTTAKTQLTGDETSCVVLSAPDNWSNSQREALKEVATNAGITVAQIIPETIAATLAYVGADATHENVVVFDIGATKATVTVVAVRDGAFSVVDSECDDSLGGDAFDKTLVTFLAKEFKKTSKLDMSGDARALGKLTAAAVDSKHILSTRTKTTVAVESLFEGIDFQYNLPRYCVCPHHHDFRNCQQWRSNARINSVVLLTLSHDTLSAINNSEALLTCSNVSSFLLGLT
eukprot:m.107869 g.107869  ORF g.107869 m.107869 type:complete len:355 (-) comp16931_c0_seq5:981-2045(-)